jgi:hypothetical protein
MPDTNSPQLRSDYARVQRRRQDPRAPERLIAHYVLERRLADRLRHAPPHERSAIYVQVYKDLFEALTDHPMKASDARQQASINVARRTRVVRRLLELGLP